MAEYGEGVGSATGLGGGNTGGSVDLGANATDFVNNAVHTIQVMPPGQLLLLVVVVLVGLVFLRKAL